MPLIKKVYLGFFTILITIISVGTLAAEETQNTRSVNITGNVSPTAPLWITAKDLTMLFTVNFQIVDPIRNQTHDFRGVLLRDIVKQYANPNTQTVRIYDFNLKFVEFNKQEWENMDISVATHQDNKLLNPSELGPMRVVFTQELVAKLDPKIYHPKWITNISSFEFMAKK